MAVPGKALALAPRATAPPDDEGAFIYGPFICSHNGLAVRLGATPTYEEWDVIGLMLAVLARGLPFCVGDWLNYGEARFGELAAQAIDQARWQPETTRVYRWLAAQVSPAVRRMDRLGLRHHLLVAKLPPGEQRAWLTRASADGNGEPWVVGRLAEAIRAGGDVRATAYYVLVSCRDAEQQAALVVRLEKDGLACRAVARYRHQRVGERRGKHGGGRKGSR